MSSRLGGGVAALGALGACLELDGCEVRLCLPCARVRPCVPCLFTGILSEVRLSTPCVRVCACVSRVFFPAPPGVFLPVSRLPPVSFYRCPGSPRCLFTGILSKTERGVRFLLRSLTLLSAIDGSRTPARDRRRDGLGTFACAGVFDRNATSVPPARARRRRIQPSAGAATAFDGARTSPPEQPA